MIGAQAAGSVARLLVGVPANRDFTPQIALPSGQMPREVVLDDYDGDGDIDIVTGNGANATISVLTNNGTGTFTQTTVLNTGANPRVRRTGDLNSDGRPDIMFVSGAVGGNAVSVYLSTPGGGFAGPTEVIPSSFGPFHGATADVNGDGFLDIANVSGGTMSVFIGHGDGTFHFTGNYSTGPALNTLTVGDVNGDARPDILVARAGSGQLSVFLNRCGAQTGTAELSVVKTDSADPVAVNSLFTYTIAVTNHGPDVATNVVVTDSLPAPNIQFVGMVTGTRTPLAGSLTCPVGTIQVDETVSITMTVRAVNGTRFNVATAIGDQVDEDFFNNTSFQQTTITPGTATFTVTSTADSGPGSLRQAIIDANANTGQRDTIAFNIGGGGAQTITLASALPNLTDSVIINAASQANPNGTPFIELNGNGVVANGVVLAAGSSGSTIRGLAINRFTGPGININTASTGNTIEGNHIGTDQTGTIARPNGSGILVSSANNTIGGSTGGTVRNLISGNTGNGILISAGTGNRVSGNSIFSNGNIEIDLGPNGVTANDPGDADVGANNLQNFPVIASATQTNSTRILGTLNSAANTTFTLEFFASPACDPSGNGEGQTFVGSAQVTTDAAGNALFDVTFAPTVPSGQAVTGTATDPAGNTSELSACRTAAAGAAVFTVTTTADTGAGSLRQAILDANANVGQTDTINFNIPGAGPHVIPVPSVLPELTDPAVIDATTQPGYAGVPLVQLSAGFGGNGSGLRITAGASTIRGLSITGFPSSGIWILGNGGNVVEANYIGLTPAGVATGNVTGIVIESTSGNRIGSTSAAGRNVISSNTSGGIFIAGAAATNNTVVGNFIGLDPAGSAARPNLGGVTIQSGASNNVIGGTAAGATNVISGSSTSNGVTITSGPANLVQGIASARTRQARRLWQRGRRRLHHSPRQHDWRRCSGLEQPHLRQQWRGRSAVGRDRDVEHRPRQHDRDEHRAHRRSTERGRREHTEWRVEQQHRSRLDRFRVQHDRLQQRPWSQRGVRHGQPDFRQPDLQQHWTRYRPGSAGITPNDAGDPDGGANNLQNFPVVTSAATTGTTTVVGSR